MLFKLGVFIFLANCSILIAQGQSLGKLERRAINRTHLTFVNGDTVQRFTVTDARPTPRPNRFYYWQGPTQILRTAGAYDGRLLTGAYQLTSRNGNLLGSGSFHHGLKTGQWRTWRPDGTPVSSSAWRRGRQRGQTRYYDATGQRLKAAAPVPVVATASSAPSPASPRFWQPAYWQAVLKSRKLRRQEKQKAKAVSPKAVPLNKPAKKSRITPTVPPGTAPTSSHPGS